MFEFAPTPEVSPGHRVVFSDGRFTLPCEKLMSSRHFTVEGDSHKARVLTRETWLSRDGTRAN